MTNFNCTIRISGPKLCTVREKTATMSQNTTGSESTKPWEYLFSQMLELHWSITIPFCHHQKQMSQFFRSHVFLVSRNKNNTKTARETTQLSSHLSITQCFRTLLDSGIIPNHHPYLFTLVHTYVVLLNCTDPKNGRPGDDFIEGNKNSSTNMSRL